ACARPLNFTVRVPVNPYHYVLSLRLSHPSLDLAEATSRFALAPYRAWRSGTPRATPTGTSLPGIYDGSYWTAPLLGGAKTLSTDVSLESALAAVVELVTPQREFLAHVRNSGGSCECFVGLFASANYGLTLPAGLMRDLSEVGLDVSIDAHP